MITVRQHVERAAAEKDLHRRQVELVRASLRCRASRPSRSRRDSRPGR